MTNQTIKRTSALLSLLMSVSLFASCGGGSGTSQTETTAGNADTVADTTADKYSGFPALEARNFDGKKFNLLLRSEWDYEFMIDEETGDTVDDAVYKRNGIIEDTYNVDLNFIDMKGTWGSHMDFTNAIHNSVLAGDGAYDAIAGYQCVITYNIVNGDLLNLYDLDYLELSAPWWTQEGVEALTQNGKCFMVGGDIVVSMLSSIQCMFFNKQLAEDYKTPDLYELVRSGNWTHDKFLEVTKGLYRDINANDTRDEEDAYGHVSTGYGLRNYVVTYDTPTVRDGGLVWMTERTVEVVEKLVDAFQTDNWYSDKAGDIFRAGRTMLITNSLGGAETLRDMEDDFGIIPYPKLDESQASYLTTTGNSCSMMCIPITAPKPDDSAFIIEAMCRESTDTIATAFYDVALQGKYARDEQSLEMINLIRSCLTFDFGWVSSLVVGVSGQQYENAVKQNNKNFASWYDTNKSSVEGKLEGYLEAYQ